MPQTYMYKCMCFIGKNLHQQMKHFFNLKAPTKNKYLYLNNYKETITSSTWYM